MQRSITEKFTEGLADLEKTRNADAIAMLFTAEAEVGNVIAPEKFYGVEGAREFWTKYRDTFATMTSTFRNTVVGDDRIALEWNTEATTSDGRSIQYSGVSVLELQGDGISRFRAYFDSAALGKQLASTAQR